MSLSKRDSLAATRATVPRVLLDAPTSVAEGAPSISKPLTLSTPESYPDSPIEEEDEEPRIGEEWASTANVTNIWGESVDFAILIEEIPGGALLAEPFSGGSQGFVAPCLKVQPESDGTHRFVVRKVANLELDQISERSGQPSEIFYNWCLSGYRGKVDMTNVFSFRADPRSSRRPGVWTMYFPYVRGGTFSLWVDKLREWSPSSPRELLPPLFAWGFFRAACHWLGYLKFGWLPGMDLEQTQPWHSLCHGDLHEGNVLLDFSNARRSGGVPDFLLADFGHARFGVEQRSGLPREAPFDDAHEMKMIHGILKDTIELYMDQTMPGAAELIELVNERFPKVQTFARLGLQPDQVMTASDECVNYADIPSVSPWQTFWIDPQDHPKETYEELKEHNPLAYEMVTELLPIAEQTIGHLMSDPANHIKVFKEWDPDNEHWTRLQEAAPGRPKLVRVRPGDRAPHYIRQIEGCWKWVAITRDNKIVGKIEEQYAPLFPHYPVSTWELTQRYE